MKSCSNAMRFITLFVRAFIFFFVVEMRTQETATINVEIQKLGEPTIHLTLAEDSTVADALREAGLNTNSEARVAGQLAYPENLLDDGDVIVVATAKITQG